MILEKKKGADVKKIEPLRHVVDARHIQNLGQNSVSDRHQAVLEIAKNAYDADAGNLLVTLVGKTTSAGQQYIKIEKIRFFDNGNGMTYEDLKDRWMRIATDSKVRETDSPVKKRRVSGEKGMGRFSMQKLGQKVTITTNPFNRIGVVGHVVGKSEPMTRWRLRFRTVSPKFSDNPAVVTQTDQLGRIG